MSKSLDKLNVVFIGAGGLAWSVSHALKQAGVAIRQIVNPTSSHGLLLAEKLGCGFAPLLSLVEREADIYFLAVPDRTIGMVAEELELQLPAGALVVHSSGSVSINVLNRHANAAVFYPFQTFTRGRVVNLSDVAVFVEASNDSTLGLITSIANALTSRVIPITSEQRLQIHLAGVVGNNFTNFLIGQSGEFLQKQGFSMDILYPLIQETVNKAFELSPEEAQTGPAIRNDLAVVEKHLAMLSTLPQLQRLYALFSELIGQQRFLNNTNNDTTSHE